MSDSNNSSKNKLNEQLLEAVTSWEQDDWDMIEDLIKDGADVNAKDKNGATALMLATKNLFVAVIRKLCELGADVNIKDKNGNTAMMQVCFNKKLPESYLKEDIVSLLCEYKADVNAKDKNG
ncbi:ankyrin repeat domain-containing protein, partial [bacterium]|nr:ankyrin repeat domain-containing protein [bacterium]